MQPGASAGIRNQANKVFIIKKGVTAIVFFHFRHYLMEAAFFHNIMDGRQS